MRFQQKVTAAAGIVAAFAATAHTSVALLGGQAEALPTARMPGRMKPEAADSEGTFNNTVFLKARERAVQNAAPQRVGPLANVVELSPRIAYKQGAGYLKFEQGVLDARENTFGMHEDAWVHIAFHMNKPSRRVLLLVSGETNQAGVKLSWGKNKMSTFESVVIRGTGPKVIPLLIETEAVGKYTIVFRIRPEENKFTPFVFRRVEVLDLN